MSLLHHHLDRAAAAAPQRTVIESEGRSLTLSQLRRAAYELANWLTGCGVKHEDRVIIVAENQLMTVALLYGVATVGGCFIPAHPDTTDEQLSYIRSNSEAVVVISFEDGNWVADLDGRRVRVPPLEEHCASVCPDGMLKCYEPALISEDPACIIYTSGSTGRPKGVTCLHGQMVFAIQAIASALDYREDDRIFCALPLSFDYGLYQVFLAIETGGTLCLENPEIGTLGLFKSLKERRANTFPAVPPMIEALAVLGKRKPGLLPDLRLITNTGATPSPASIKTLRGAFTGLGFQLMYGLTECKRASIAPVDGDLLKPGTCGVPLEGTRITIVDADGSPVPSGEIGEIVVRGPHVMAGYWRARELTEKVYRKRHATLRCLHSGDYGWMDEDGYLYCQGRRDDIFKIRGFRVSCSEIEAACAEAPGVHHAVMVPPASGRPGTLFVCLSDESFDIEQFLRERLEPHKVPEKIRLVAQMPLSSNNKFDRKALARLLDDQSPQDALTAQEELTHA